MIETIAQPASAAQIERRCQNRYKAEEMPSITKIRLSPLRIQATMVDVSTTGILVECGTRIQPNSNVSVTFETEASLGTVSGRVARTTVAALDATGSLRYHVGIAFTTPIPLKTPLPAETQEVPAPASPEPGPQPQRVIRNRW